LGAEVRPGCLFEDHTAKLGQDDEEVKTLQFVLAQRESQSTYAETKPQREGMRVVYWWYTTKHHICWNNLIMTLKQRSWSRSCPEAPYGEGARGGRCHKGATAWLQRALGWGNNKGCFLHCFYCELDCLDSQLIFA
jgi:hypothetical protein